MARTTVRTTTASAELARADQPLRREPRLSPPPLSFEQLVAEHQQRVAGLCYRLLGWQGEVEDVVQDVFLSVCEALPDYRGESQVSTWITRIAINACRNHIRKRLRFLRRLVPLAPTHDTAPTAAADRGLMSQEQFEHVRASVGRLPRKYREVIVLRYLEELPVSEIAAVLELSRNAVEVRLNRARKLLREYLASLLEG
jgi:RNA polymerase sigma-70 factor (ECF subfamily)